MNTNTQQNIDLIRNMFSELIVSGQTDAASISRYMHKDYIQYVDGKSLDLPGFQAHLTRQREVLARMGVDMLAIAGDGDYVLTHHRVKVYKKNGEQALFQVLAHFILRDGLVVVCDELTRMLEGVHTDHDLGSRH